MGQGRLMGGNTVAVLQHTYSTLLSATTVSWRAMKGPCLQQSNRQVHPCHGVGTAWVRVGCRVATQLLYFNTHAVHPCLSELESHTRTMLKIIKETCSPLQVMARGGDIKSAQAKILSCPSKDNFYFIFLNNGTCTAVQQT